MGVERVEGWVWVFLCMGTGVWYVDGESFLGWAGEADVEMLSVSIFNGIVVCRRGVAFWMMGFCLSE